MEKTKWMKRAFIGVGCASAAIITAIGLCFGSVIEGNLLEEIGKWIVVGLGVTGILEVFTYIVGPSIYHATHDKKK